MFPLSVVLVFSRPY